MDSDRDIERRAYAAWFRGGGAEPPDPAESGLVDHDGHRYVVLRAAGRVLVVYRVTNQGPLRRLRRPPKALLGEV